MIQSRRSLEAPQRENRREISEKEALAKINYTRSDTYESLKPIKQAERKIVSFLLIPHLFPFLFLFNLAKWSHTKVLKSASNFSTRSLTLDWFC